MCTQLTKIEEKQTLANSCESWINLHRDPNFQEREYTDVHDTHLICNYILRMCYKKISFASRNHHMTHRSPSRESPKVAVKFHHTWLCKQLYWKDHVVNHSLLLLGNSWRAVSKIVSVTDCCGDTILTFGVLEEFRFQFSWQLEFSDLLGQNDKTLCSCTFHIASFAMYILYFM